MLAIVRQNDFEHRLTLSNIKEFIPYIHNDDGKISHFANLPDPRIFRTENPVYPESYPKAIYVVRDPRAVLVSFYHHYRTVINGCKMTLQAFVEEYLLHGYIRNFSPQLSRWDKQVLEWIRRSDQNERVMIVKYEDMAHDRRGVLEKVVKFVGIPCTEGNIALAAARGSFEAMRADEEQHGAESYPGKIGQRGRFIRRGKIDGWVGEMAPDLAEKIERVFTKAMKKAGYL
jgi:hypothetical protein